MSTVTATILSLVALSTGGAAVALALARLRLVTLPMAPLTGAVLASLSVAAMTWIGGAVVGWYIGLSALSALIAVLIWWRLPAARPWCRTTARAPARPLAVIAFMAAVGACALGLTVLVNPLVSYDGRAIWTLHAVWYLAGHAATVAALHNPALVFSHPRYPPLIGGAIALSWAIAGSQSVRLGVVVMSCLTAFAVVAASTGIMELARRVLPTGSGRQDRRCRAMSLGAGVVVSVLLALVAFAAAGRYATDGHADLLWAVAAVGAIAYGLVLPLEPPYLGAAVLMVAVAGDTKIEGTLTGAAIVLLIAARGVLAARSAGARRPWLQPSGYTCGTLLVIGAWPLVTYLLNALPDVEFAGARTGTDQSRLIATLHDAAPYLGMLAVAVPVAIVGAVFLHTRRRASGIGNDSWGWVALLVGLGVVVAAYVTGPGSIKLWLMTSIRRTTLFPLIAAWWIMGTWVVVAAGAIPNSLADRARPYLSKGTSFAETENLLKERGSSRSEVPLRSPQDEPGL